MKKGAKIALTITLIIIIPALGILGYLFFTEIAWYGTGGRYDDSALTDMGVIYETQADINSWNEGYSASDVCPWGFVHEGLDYFYNNNSAVLAAAPGKVHEIKYRDNGEEVDNRFWVSITIRFNRTVDVYYNFESWTNQSSDWENQKSMIAVVEGDWVEKGQEFARFLTVGNGAHIHFDVKEGKTKPCPMKYLSTVAYNELLSLVHSYHPTWDLCYP